jgi:MerR family transcriptional regulator/heat shock protein HspR
MARANPKQRPVGYMISAVAEKYGLHPQTLRMYEREGLLTPSRSEGNTRLYTEKDLERLETILHLTRDLGVNLAGTEIILNMRERLEQMEQQMRAFVEFVRQEMLGRASRSPERPVNAMVRVGPPQLVRATARRVENPRPKPPRPA